MPLFALLLAGMFVEIAVLIAVGNVIGPLYTVLLLLAGMFAGIALLRREGAKTFKAFSDSIFRQQQPHQEMADGVLIATAGVLIMWPGFISDVVALFLLVPATRRLVSKRMARKTEAAALKMQHERRFGAGQVVDGEVVTVDADAVVITDRRELT